MKKADVVAELTSRNFTFEPDELASELRKMLTEHIKATIDPEVAEDPALKYKN
jgi:hypothetical protein